MAKLIQDLSIGGNLRKLREARGLTQEDVCARMAQLGRPMLQSAYSQIETGPVSYTHLTLPTKA